jgi:16S rRNA (guanine527-N7)-methyltransferase
MGLTLPRTTQQCLLRFLGLLTRWNRVFNLSGHRDPHAMISCHILDSLAVVPYLHGHRVLDLGTGAGLPGIPLAVALPGMDFTLLDSSAKKIRFVQQAVIELGLGNVELVRARAERFHPSAPFDTVVSRAFTSLTSLLGYTVPLCRSGGYLLALKGPRAHTEADALPPGIEYQIYPLMVPGLDAKRHLVRLWIHPGASAQSAQGES